MSIAEPIFYRSMKQFADMGGAEIRHFRQLEGGNARLKEFVANPTLDNTMLQDVLRTQW